MKKKQTKTTSTRFSLTGWSLKEFLKGYLNIFRKNWSIIKELGKVLTPAILTWLATQNPIWTVVITAFAKALFDIAEYYVRVYK